ncbi:hypothetical protein D3C81_616170 [compost metagenome]
MHAIELFSIGVETHHPLLTQKRADLIKTAVVFEFQTPQETVATDGQQQITQALLQTLEQALQVRQHRPRGHGGEDDAVFHGAVETQAQVRMHLLDGPHVVLLVDPHCQRVRGEDPVIELRHRHADVPGVLGGGRLGIEFEDPAQGAVGPGDHQLFGAGQHVVGGEHFEIQPGIDQHHHGRAAVELAIEVHMGMGQVVIVAGRAAEMRNVAQCRAQGRQDHFFTAGQAIEQGQGKAVALDRGQGVAATATDQALDHLLGVDQAEVFHLVDQLDRDGKVPMIEAHRCHAIASIAQRGDFPGAGAAHQANAAEALLQGLAQRLQVVLGGTEEQHEPQVRVQQLSCQFLRDLPGIGGLGHCTDDAFALLHPYLPQVRVYEARVYEVCGGRRMLLG